MRLGAPIFAIAAFACGALAETRYVSPQGGHVPPFTNWAGAATTIVAAVDTSSDGDTVLVTNGTYLLTSQVIVDKGVTIQSVNGAATTFVNGSSTTRCFVLAHAAAVLDGLTVTNGRVSDDGGGIYAFAGSQVRNCVVTGNRSGRFGGGILARDGVVVESCVIRGNRSDTYGGGGIGCGDAAEVRWCVIEANEAAGLGDGGGVSCIYDAKIIGCIIASNKARVGGGVQALYHNRLENCLLVGNVAKQGGGLNCSQYTTIQNCTIASNTAEVGGGVDAFFGGLIRNSIVYRNTAATGSNYTQRSVGLNVLSFTNSCAAPLPAGSGNIATDPLWVSPGGGNFRLTAASPCVDTGQNAGAPTNDLDHFTRPFDGDTNSVAVVDMGAYEFH